MNFINPSAQHLQARRPVPDLSADLHDYGIRQNLLAQSATNRVIQKSRTDVYAHIQRSPVNFFDNLPAGKVVSRVTNDTEAVKDLFVAVLSNFSSGAVYITGVYVALFLLDVRLGLISLFVIPMLIVWTILYRKFATKYNTVIRSRLSEINAIINESIQGMAIIRVFRRQKRPKKSSSP